MPLLDDNGNLMPASGGGSILGDLSALAGRYWEYQLRKDIDSERQQPFLVNDPAGYQYMVGPGGQLFTRGQPSALLPASVSSNPLIVVALIGAAGLALYLALK